MKASMPPRPIVAWLSAMLLAICASALPRPAPAAPGSQGDGGDCMAIPPRKAASWLLFNPTGMQTYYALARCLQEAAVQLRAPALCSGVRERKAWFLDGSAYSPSACLAAVRHRKQRDASAAKNLHAPQALQRVWIERNDNGRDFDVHLLTSGGAGGGLHLRLSLLDAVGIEHVLRDGTQPMDDKPGELNLLLPAADLRRAWRESSHAGPIRLRARLQRIPGNDDERAVFSHVPQLLQASSVETTVDPALVEPGR
jgi:hypothetical protein